MMLGLYVVQLGTPESERMRYDLIIATSPLNAARLAGEEYPETFFGIQSFSDDTYALSDVRMALLRMTASLCGLMAAQHPKNTGDWEIGYATACDLGRAISVHIADIEYRDAVIKRSSDWVERMVNLYGIQVL